MMPAVLLVSTSFAGCDRILAVVLLTLGVGCMGFAMAGFGVNHLDMAPRFAGTLAGLTNAIGTIPGFVAPTVIGLMTNNNETIGQWRIYFFLTAAIYVCGTLAFIVFGKGEEQPWAYGYPCLTFTVNQEKTILLQASDETPPKHI